MNELQKRSNKIESIAVIALAVVLGSIIRLGYILKSDFPLVDGGLFYKMTLELVQNRFALPFATTYNHLNIPYAYPPLPFYLAGFLNAAFKIDLLTIFRFFPFLLNIASIPVVYFIAKRILQNNSQANLAVITYALIRPGYDSFIYGGGLNRSMAWLFATIAILQLLTYFSTKKIRDAIWLPVFFSLVVFCHLEIAWLLAFSFVLLFIFYQRTRTGFLTLFLVGVAVIVLTSVYWFRIVHLYGFQTFINAFQTSHFSISDALVKFLRFGFSEEIVFPLLGAFAFIGFFAAIASKKYLLPAWLIAILLLDFRSVDRSAVLVISLLSALALDTVILKGIRSLIPPPDISQPDKKKSWLSRIHIETILVEVIFMITFLGAALEITNTSNVFVRSISSEDLYAMNWVREYTPRDSRFLIVDSAIAWHIDPQAEWFPALADRQSIFTPQGSEWLPDHAYAQKLLDDGLFRLNLSNRSNFLPDWLIAHQTEYQYVYLEKEMLDKLNMGKEDFPSFLKTVYESRSVLILQKN